MAVSFSHQQYNIVTINVNHCMMNMNVVKKRVKEAIRYVGGAEG